MFYHCDRNDHGLRHNPFKACVIPRPIGWVSTISRDGVPNLSPFSFFAAVNERPPMVMFCAGGRHVAGGEKDSVLNARETGEFVVNLATYALRDAVNASSAQVDRHVDEFQLAGVTPIPGLLVKAPRVAESPVHLECAVHAIHELPCSEEGWLSRMVVGRVLGIHIDDAMIDDGMIKAERLQAISRLGYMDYAVTQEVFQLSRPK